MFLGASCIEEIYLRGQVLQVIQVFPTRLPAGLVASGPCSGSVHPARVLTWAVRPFLRLEPIPTGRSRGGRDDCQLVL